jgi:hypothetical protein
MTGRASCWHLRRGPISIILASRSAKVGVYTANDSAYAAAIDLKKAGFRNAGDRRCADRSGRALVERAKELGIEVLTGQR